MDELVDMINDFLDEQSDKEIQNMGKICKHMNSWRIRYDGKFRSSQIFWDMFFKEMKSLVE